MNRLYYGDNLAILREQIPDASVDLIYLDPPFNSNRSYNVLFREASGKSADAQITAFDDTWHWGAAAEETLREIETTAPQHVVEMMQAIVGFVGRNDVSAYLVMMTVRLIELHRALKPTGSLYLHCDPTASHYLKVVLDTVFGVTNFCNHIIWQRSDTHNDAKRQFPAVSDHILFYRKSESQVFRRQHVGHADKTLRDWYLYLEFPDGSVRKMTQEERESQRIPPGARRFNAADMTSPNPRPNLMYEYRGYPYPAKGWRYSRETMEQLDREGKLLFPSSPGGRIMRKRYLDEQEGVTVADVWSDISQLRASMSERLGYPTQKPLALLERIIQASSNPGDLVLDPFCGCGTTVCAAQKLGRQWAGIDITHLAIALMRQRLDDMFGASVEYEVVGQPADLASAEALARADRYQFQMWALSLIKARPWQSKKGADQGADGVLYFEDEARQLAKKAVIQVKSGGVGSPVIRDLGHVVEREKAALGFLITLEQPTRPMEIEALAAGYYHSPGWNRDYPRLQIRTVAQLLEGRVFDYPQANVTLSRAEREQAQGEQGRLL